MERLQKSAVIEPVDPFERCEFNYFQRSRGPAPADDFRFVKAVDRFRQRVVVTVTDAADRRRHA